MAQKLGTYILNRKGEEELKLVDRYFNQCHDRIGSFPAMLPPITHALPVADNDDCPVGLFYNLFTTDRFEHNFHIYLKSAIYAYKQLVDCTDILEVGKVRFFIDCRGAEIAMPYFKAAGIDSLVRFFDLQPWFEGSNYLWLPLSSRYRHLEHPDFSDVHYILTIDVDYYYINISNAPKIEFAKTCKILENTADAEMYGPISSGKQRPMEGFYYEYSAQSETDKAEINKAMQGLFSEPYPSYRGEAERFMAGQMIGFRNHSDTLKKWMDFYNTYGFIAKDEVILHAFLATYPEIEPIPFGIHPCEIFREADVREYPSWVKYNVLINTGIYWFIDSHVIEKTEPIYKYLISKNND